MASAAQSLAADDGGDADALCPICWTPTATRPPEDVYQSVVDGQVYIREHLLQWLADHQVSPRTSEDARADIDRLWPARFRGLSVASRARLSALDTQLWATGLFCYVALGALAVAGMSIVAATPDAKDGQPGVSASTVSLLFGLRNVSYGLVGGSLASYAGRAGIAFYLRSRGARTVANAHLPQPRVQPAGGHLQPPAAPAVAEAQNSPD